MSGKGLGFLATREEIRWRITHKLAGNVLTVSFG